MTDQSQALALAMKALEKIANGDNPRPSRAAGAYYEAKDIAIEALQSLRQISQPDSGWRLVPIEPTEEMVAASLIALTEWRKTLSPDEAILRRSEPIQSGRVWLASATPEEKAAIRYRAMLAAAPLDLAGDDEPRPVEPAGEDEPYTADQRMVCDYLQSIAPDVGCGLDPVGFLIASHASISFKARERIAELEAALNPHAELIEAAVKYRDIAKDHPAAIDRRTKYGETMAALLRAAERLGEG